MEGRKKIECKEVKEEKRYGKKENNRDKKEKRLNQSEQAKKK